MALVLTINGVPRTSVLVDGSLSVESRAEGFVSVCSFTLYDANHNITISEEDVITLVDGATTFFAGRVVDVDYKPFTSASRNIAVACQDLNAILDETIIDSVRTFTALADSAIIDTLFDDYLPAVDSETYVVTIQDPLTIEFEPTTLRSALSQICTRTGGYFYIDFDNKLHYFLAEANVSPWWLSDAPDNVDSFSYFVNPSKSLRATTRLDGVFVVGAGISGWRGTHAPQDRQAIARDNRITTGTGRDQRGDAILSKLGDAQVIYNVSTYKSGLKAGMDVRFICALYGVDDTFTVRRMTVKWDISGTAYYQLELGDAVNPSLGQGRTFRDTVDQSLGPISSPRLPTSSKGWIHTLIFSATDHDTVAWSAGSIILADGTTYAIDAGNTGNMAAITYIFLDIDTSITVLQTTTDSSVAVGSGKIMIAVAAPVAVGKDATFKVFGGASLALITADDIAANTITTNEIAANTIVAGNIAAGAIETDELAALAVTAAKIAAHTITADKLSIGQFLYNSIDGLLLLGPHCYISPVEWRSLRGQKAILSGGYHTTQGMWLGTRGLVIEEATINLIVNPSFEINVTDGWTAGGLDTWTRITTDKTFGTACGRMYKAVLAGTGYIYSPYIVAIPAANYSFSVYINRKQLSSAGTVSVRMYFCKADYSIISNVNQTFTGQSPTWVRGCVSGTAPALTAYIWCFVYVSAADSSVAEVLVDGAQAEAKAYITSYCDGSLGYGYAWTGTAHNSISTRTTNECNLDAHIGLISGRNLVSYRLVCRAPYGATATWPFSLSIFMEASDDAEVNGVAIYFDSTSDTLRVLLWTGASTVTLISSTQTFVAGDWLDLMITANYTSDSYKLYVNGVLEDTDATALSVPTLTQWNLGSTHLGTYQTGAAFCEFAVFGRVLEAYEVAQLFELQQCLVDSGSLATPGIYIMDGNFRMCSSTLGVRIEITAAEIAGYNAAGTKQFYLQASDGKAYTGGGNVVLDSSGITLLAEDLVSARIKWDLAGAVNLGYLGGFQSAPYNYILARLPSPANTNLSTSIYLQADAFAGQESCFFTIISGRTGSASAAMKFQTGGVEQVLVNNSYAQFTGDLIGKTISTDGGANKYDFNAWVAGAIGCDGYIKCEVNGVKFRFLAAAGW